MDNWSLFLVLIGIMAAFDGLSLFANRFIVTKTINSQKDRYQDQLEQAAKQCTELTVQVRNYQSVERQLLELKADLPISYVRKEDFIRHEVAINAKLDRIYEVLSNQNKGGC